MRQNEIRAWIYRDLVKKAHVRDLRLAIRRFDDIKVVDADEETITLFKAIRDELVTREVVDQLGAAPVATEKEE